MPSLARRFLAEGHLIDSGLLTRMLNIIVDAGADYTVVAFSMGKVRTDSSHLELEVRCGGRAAARRRHRPPGEPGLLRERGAGGACCAPAPKDSCVPDDFYATTNRRTQVFRGGEWRDVADMRMDGVIVDAGTGSPAGSSAT